MSKFSNVKIKWPKSVEKLENGGRLGPLRQDLPPPQKKNKQTKNGTLDPPLIRIRHHPLSDPYQARRLPALCARTPERVASA